MRKTELQRELDRISEDPEIMIRAENGQTLGIYGVEGEAGGATGRKGGEAYLQARLQHSEAPVGSSAAGAPEKSGSTPPRR